MMLQLHLKDKPFYCLLNKVWLILEVWQHWPQRWDFHSFFYYNLEIVIVELYYHREVTGGVILLQGGDIVTEILYCDFCYREVILLQEGWYCYRKMILELLLPGDYLVTGGVILLQEDDIVIIVTGRWSCYRRGDIVIWPPCNNT